MGWVYRARDIVLDRHVALKVLHISRNVDVEPKERFYREARACTKLQHPSIVMVHDTGEAAGAAYIVMELLRGTDLRRYIHESRPLSLAQKLEFLAQVCDRLAHAHESAEETSRRENPDRRGVRDATPRGGAGPSHKLRYTDGFRRCLPKQRASRRTADRECAGFGSGRRAVARDGVYPFAAGV